jgi:hypothetical protein
MFDGCLLDENPVDPVPRLFSDPVGALVADGRLHAVHEQIYFRHGPRRVDQAGIDETRDDLVDIGGYLGRRLSEYCPDVGDYRGPVACPVAQLPGDCSNAIEAMHSVGAGIVENEIALDLTDSKPPFDREPHQRGVSSHISHTAVGDEKAKPIP